MKKLIIFGIIILFSFSHTYADDAMNKISKEVVLTTQKVKEDYGDEYIKILDSYFNNIRYYNDSTSLNNIKKVLEPLVQKYNKKMNLTSEEEKVFNLMKNMYYRSQLLNYFVK